MGVCVVKGDVTVEPDKYGHWLVCEDPMTPVIIEAVRKSDYKSFSAFQSAAMARPTTLKQTVLRYQSLGGDQLTFYADQSRLPKINGTVVDLAPQKVYDSPFVQSDWDSGVVTIQCGDEQRILDFNEE